MPAPARAARAMPPIHEESAGRARQAAIVRERVVERAAWLQAVRERTLWAIIYRLLLLVLLLLLLTHYSCSLLIFLCALALPLLLPLLLLLLLLLSLLLLSLLLPEGDR